MPKIVTFDADDTLYDMYTYQGLDTKGRKGSGTVYFDGLDRVNLKSTIIPNLNVIKSLNYAYALGYKVIILSINPLGTVEKRLESSNIYLPDDVDIVECGSKRDAVEIIRQYDQSAEFVLHVGDSEVMDLPLCRKDIPVLLYGIDGKEDFEVNEENVFEVFCDLIGDSTKRAKVLEDNIEYSKPKTFFGRGGYVTDEEIDLHGGGYFLGEDEGAVEDEEQFSLKKWLQDKLGG